MTTSLRRRFLKGAVASVLVLAAGLRHPRRALAAGWPRRAFRATRLAQALSALYGTNELIFSDAVTMTAPRQAENGAMVPIVAAAELPGAESISVLVARNPNPLAAHLELNGAEPYLTTRLKLSRTSEVYVVCRAGGKLYSNHQTIKITVGGCGG